MKLVTWLSADRMRGAEGPFWPSQVKRLTVVVWRPDPHHDAMLAIAVDPDHDRGRGHVVADATLSHAQLGAFIKAVVEGKRIERDHCHDVTPVPDCGQRAHKTALALAKAIRADVRLAEAVLNPDPPLPFVVQCAHGRPLPKGARAIAQDSKRRSDRDIR
jgi:hypothetical protein